MDLTLAKYFDKLAGYCNRNRINFKIVFIQITLSLSALC